MSSELPLLLEAGAFCFNDPAYLDYQNPSDRDQILSVQKDYQPIEELQAFNIADSSGSSSIKILITLYLQEFLFFKNSNSFFISSLWHDGRNPAFAVVHPQSGQAHLQTSENTQILRYRNQPFAAGAVLAAWKTAVNFDQNTAFGFALVFQNVLNRPIPSKENSCGFWVLMKRRQPLS